MKILTTPIIISLTLAISGCASMMPPNAQNLAQLPIVHFGEQAPADHKFILHYPAGTSLPMVASVTGTLLDKSDETTLKVTLKKDVYIYQQWVSFDGTHWQSGKDIVDDKFLISLPGEADGNSPGKLSAEFNLK